MTALPNIALIGIGRIGVVHARTLARLGHRGRFAMIVDPREDVARALAAELNVPKVSTDPGDAFDHDAAKGFIRLWGLGQQTQAAQQLLKGGKGFELPGLPGAEKK